MRLNVALPIVLALALAACGGEPDETATNDALTAPGEVLEGSISDEMLPYDRVRSQPPLAEIVAEDDPATPRDGAALPPPASSGAAADAGADAGAEAEPEAAPLAEPEAD